MNTPITLEEKQVSASQAQMKAITKWKAKSVKRIPLEVRKEYWESVVSKLPEITGMSVNGFIKAAIQEKIARDGLDLPDIKP